MTTSSLLSEGSYSNEFWYKVVALFVISIALFFLVWNYPYQKNGTKEKLVDSWTQWAQNFNFNKKNGLNKKMK